MYKDKKIWLAQSDKNLFLLPNMANRHGLIAGATGTGKTITMKVMAESFSDMGVPVFMADVKGDVSGMCVPGADSADMRGRIERFGIEGFEYKSYPTRFWDIFGEQGYPVRVTISDMGPVLLARLLGLTDVQAGVLNIVFKVADEHGLLLLDMKDLRAMLQFVGDNRADSPRSTAMSPPRASARYSARCWPLRTRAARYSSANPRLTSATGCAPTPTAAAI